MIKWKIFGKLNYHPDTIAAYTITGPTGDPKYLYFLEGGEAGKIKIAESTADFKVGDEIDESMIRKSPAFKF